MRRDHLFLSVLLVVGLTLSYIASKQKDPLNQDRIELLSVNIDRVHSIRLLRGDFEVIAERRKINPAQFWINYLKREKKQKTLPGFLASEDFDFFLRSFQPFYVDRKLGVLQESDRDKYGFSENKDQLTLLDSSGNSLLNLEFGKKSYGTGNIFTLVNDSPQLYLLDGAQLDKLYNARFRLNAESPFYFDLDLETRVVVKFGREEKIFYFTPGRGKEKDKWGKLVDDAKQPHSSSIASWFGNLQKIKIKSYMKLQEAPLFDSYEEVLHLSYDNESVSIRRKRQDDSGNRYLYFVNSKLLQHPVQIEQQRVENIFRDFSNL